MDGHDGQGGGGAAGGGPPVAGARPANKRLQQTQAQVDEVVGIMKVCDFIVKHFELFNYFYR